MNQEQLNEKLLEAIENNYVKEVKALVQERANVDTKDSDDRTVLMWATYGGFLDIIKLLVEKGADVNAKTIFGWTALMYAVKCDSLDINIDIVELLIEKGADVNARCEEDWTVLMWAANTEYLNLVKFLIENGADVNAKNKFSRTALMYATQRNSHDIVKLLIEKGADVNAKNKNGETALTMAKIDNNKIMLMKIEGKKLPQGFTYLFSRKEIKELNRSIELKFRKVVLDGTSYSESKMARKGAISKGLGRIKILKSEDNYEFDLILDGIKIESFRGEDNLFEAKSEIKRGIINWMNTQKVLLESNRINADMSLRFSISFYSGTIKAETCEREWKW